ncbi:MAG: hypothetical protein ACKO96_07320, partial [Flammeovirgaceae bacterium]
SPGGFHQRWLKGGIKSAPWVYSTWIQAESNLISGVDVRGCNVKSNCCQFGCGLRFVPAWTQTQMCTMVLKVVPG